MDNEDVAEATREEEWHHSIDNAVSGGVFNSTSMDARLLVGTEIEDRIGHAVWWEVDNAVSEALA